MKSQIPIEQLLRWRLAQAEASAPPPPRAGQVLEMACPWWEVWPEKFRDFAQQLGLIRIAYGLAMSRPEEPGGHPVPVLFVGGAEKLETSARVLYFNVRDGRLRLRLRLNAAIPKAPENFEVTFVNPQLRPLFSAAATPSADGEYRLDIELPEPLAYEWEQLKVTDPMPFRLMIHSDKKKD